MSPIDHADRQGRTALDLARQAGRVEVMALLVEHEREALARRTLAVAVDSTVPRSRL